MMKTFSSLPKKIAQEEGVGKTALILISTRESNTLGSDKKKEIIASINYSSSKFASI